MHEGISTNRHSDSSAVCLIAAGRTFVIRYHSRTTQLPEKRLTPAEAAALARAGIEIAVVYQDRARQEVDFGAGRGEQDGTSAVIFAGQVGQPSGSAIYFAVDTDFSEAQLRSVVFPYFRAVKAAFDRAAGNETAFRIGVYGSGLTCRLLKGEFAFVEFTWLAESTGWRESRTYQDWDIKQHVNAGEALCNLADGWERCEAKDDFGQWQPVGFAVTQGEGAPMMVAATSLNLRSAPTTVGNAPIATLPQYKIVNVLGTSAPGWSRVRCTLHGGDVIGHVSSKFLAPPTADAHTIAALVMPKMPPVHLRQNNIDSQRASPDGRAFPLGEPGRPSRRTDVNAATRCADLTAIGDWLSVTTSVRYQRTGVTFCNVYATDYSYLAGVYLPRVWWTDKALASMLQGAPPPPVAYDQTVRELRADDLHQWLIEYGAQFGWRRVFDATALQDAANQGGVGLICADRAAAGLPGHITVVVPETGANVAGRDPDGHVTQPLQSQAGGRNFRYGSAGRHWWLDAQFRSFVFYVHD